MKTILLIASLLIATATSAGGGTGVVSGRANPEGIADWLVWLGLFQAAVAVEDQNALGVKYLQSIGLSEAGATQLLEQARRVIEVSDQPVSTVETCAKRAELEASSKALAWEIDRLQNVSNQRTAAAVQAALAELSVEDAAKLAAYAEREKENTTTFEVTDPEKAVEGIDPKQYLDHVCGSK